MTILLVPNPMLGGEQDLFEQYMQQRGTHLGAMSIDAHRNKYANPKIQKDWDVWQAKVPEQAERENESVY